MEQLEAARLEGELERLAREVGVTLEAGVSQRLVFFAGMTWQGQGRARLTGATSLRELVVKHLLDCLTLWRLEEIEWDRWIDVGSGGGLPGLVLAVGRENGRGDLLEATGKKAAYLQEAAGALGVQGRVRVVPERAESWGQGAGREAYRVAVARAVAPARVLVEYLIPLLEVGGKAILMKGPRAGEELEEAGKAMKLLGARVTRIDSFSLPEGIGERRLIVLEKLRPTPRQYPRRSGVPTRRPL